jgi:hypothetical protein
MNVILTSTNILNSTGYTNRTIFNFKITLESGEIIRKASWAWGDGAQTQDTVTDYNKKYTQTGTFKVSLNVTYTFNGKTLSYNYLQDILVKDFPKDSFTLSSTTTDSKPAIYARATQITLVPNVEIFGVNNSDLKFIQWDLGNGVISNNPILENNKEITEETMQSLIDRCTALTEKTMQYFADSKYENK